MKFRGYTFGRFSMFYRAVTFIGCFFLLKTAAGQQLKFNHFTVEDGLSAASTLSIAQDEKGFLWIGTMDGLNRYDGKRVKTYRNFYSANPRGSDVKISELLADQRHQLWIATNYGLYVYNNTTDSFRLFNHKAVNKHSIGLNYVSSLFLDSRGRIWVGAEDGLYIVEQRGKDFKFFPVFPKGGYGNPAGRNILAIYEISDGRMLVGTKDGLWVFHPDAKMRWRVERPDILKGLSVTSITADKQGCLWIGTNGNGLFKTDAAFRLITHYREGAKHGACLSNIIRKVLRDRRGRIWVGTLKGLNVFNPENGAIASYIHDPGDSRSLNFNSIHNLFEDRQGTIWMATFFGGLNSVEIPASPFSVYQNEEKETSISSNIIGAIVDDTHNNLWIGTEAEGLDYFDRHRLLFVRYKNGIQKKAALSSNLVKALVRDQYNHIWVGLSGGGVNTIDAGGHKVKEFRAGKEGAYTINSENVSSLMKDSQGRIWIGNELDGINIYDFETDKTRKFEAVYPGKTLSNEAITFLFQDTKGNIWIGTRGGLNKLAAGENRMEVLSRKNYPLGLPADYINCIAEDRQRLIWIGSAAGLSCFDPVKKTMKRYSRRDGLGGNKVLGIVVDTQDNLWISTNNGLSRLDAARAHFATFDVHDGLPGNVFNYNSFFKDKQGLLFFGGYKGMIVFDPEKVVINKVPPPVMLTGLKINGHNINVGDPSGILQHDIAESREIELKHYQNVMVVDYAVMNFIKPAKNRSAYMIEGYNKDWIYTTEHSASFTNLPGGSYNLLIRAANNDGIWNDRPYVLKIKILSPPWKTWWAYTLYLLFISALAAGIIYFISLRTALRRKLRYERMLHAKQEELHRMKMDFFTHISHEIRTPLTLITGPVEMLGQLIPAGSAGQRLLNTVRNNTERLLKLVTDLLDFRKADSGHTQLKMRPADIVAFSQSVYEKFAEAAARKFIDYRFTYDLQSIEVYFDPHHMEIVFANLLSNAIKFTPEQGRVWMHIGMSDSETVRVTVGDNGIGIPRESQDKIFSGYYQANSGGIKNVGSGIGLAFSKSLVALHKGTLEFTSEISPQTGRQETVFMVNLRLGKKHYNDLPAE